MRNSATGQTRSGERERDRASESVRKSKGETGRKKERLFLSNSN